MIVIAPKRGASEGPPNLIRQVLAWFLMAAGLDGSHSEGALPLRRMMLRCTTVLSKLAIDYSLMGEDRERPLIEALSDFMPLLKALRGLKEGISRTSFAKARLLF